MRIIRVAPFTVLILVSLLGVVISGMLDASPWSVVVFYMFGLPYYGAALTTVVLGHLPGAPRGGGRGSGALSREGAKGSGP